MSGNEVVQDDVNAILRELREGQYAESQPYGAHRVRRRDETGDVRGYGRPSVRRRFEDLNLDDDGNGNGDGGEDDEVASEGGAGLPNRPPSPMARVPEPGEPPQFVPLHGPKPLWGDDDEDDRDARADLVRSGRPTDACFVCNLRASAHGIRTAARDEAALELVALLNYQSTAKKMCDEVIRYYKEEVRPAVVATRGLDERTRARLSQPWFRETIFAHFHEHNPASLPFFVEKQAFNDISQSTKAIADSICRVGGGADSRAALAAAKLRRVLADAGSKLSAVFERERTSAVVRLENAKKNLRGPTAADSTRSLYRESVTDGATGRM